MSISSVLPEPAIMATMECEPVSDILRDRIHLRWGETPESVTQVEVGEGLNEGEIWWIVSWRDTGEAWYSGSQFLTNAPGLPEDEDALWINSGGVYVEEKNATFGGNIHWDAEGIARVQSALAKSLDCL